jgi:hypothetical protein
MTSFGPNSGGWVAKLPANCSNRITFSQALKTSLKLCIFDILPPWFFFLIASRPPCTGVRPKRSLWLSSWLLEQMSHEKALKLTAWFLGGSHLPIACPVTKRKGSPWNLSLCACSLPCLESRNLTELYRQLWLQTPGSLQPVACSKGQKASWKQFLPQDFNCLLLLLVLDTGSDLPNLRPWNHTLRS